jgi:hypothetical protein
MLEKIVYTIRDQSAIFQLAIHCTILTLWRSRVYHVVTKSWPVTAPGSQGVFRGRGRGFGFLKKWAPGSYCLELVVACPAAGTSAQILLVEGK